ncbi:MAG: bifunctional acetate--CoA ligase family protein/GNAT family N-acetyltransferase [Alphaproteobacteria bacterium]|nr:bifunctional acetate--CoA ligase family protein/GNAT family N-acetyltransferase [Alphaproteobacteria bacterium]
MGPSKLEHLFNPRSIAVFGASESGRSVGSRVFANLLGGGFAGPIIPINPKYATVSGKRCFKTILEVDGSVDLAVIATPAATVPKIMRQCGKAGIRNAIVLSAGFGEARGDGQTLEAELIKAAKRHEVRFMGPNCVGLVRPWLSLNATFLKSATPQGGLALVSQSGALCSAISDWAEPHHLGFSILFSLGNASDIGFGDVLQFLASDPETKSILLYVEGIRDARTFISALRLAARVKPVLVLKAGRHAQSAKAANTHTGALIGSDAVFDAALERAGAVRVDTFGQLFAAAEILSSNTRASGNRLGIVTNGGGAGVLAADRTGDLHLDLPAPSAETLWTLDAKLPAFWSRGNPVDILGDAPPEHFGAAVSACLADSQFDGVLVMLTPQAMTDAVAAARAVIDAVPDNNRKPVLACWMGETSVDEARHLLSANNIPDFHTPERAVEAFSYLARHQRNRELALQTPGPLSDVEEPDVTSARNIIDAVLADGRAMLSDIESKAVMQAFHIPVNGARSASTCNDAKAAASDLGYPVAVKINSPQISHKSDVGGVRLNVVDDDDMDAAWAEVTGNARAAMPDAKIAGVTVEPMIDMKDGRELVVGSSRDPVFGPTILFGAGGTMVEVLRDSAVSLPSLNAVLANRLINRTRVSRLLSAFRGKPAADRDAVISVLLRLSDLVCELPEIDELDINPLLASPQGVICMDARIAVSRQPDGAGRYRHLAIEPYPRHLEQRLNLDDGTPLIIRPIRPEDAQSERNFVRDLSNQAKKFRFMHALNELSPAMLARFTQIDYDREMALVAFTLENDKPVQQGVARYSINQDDTSCEFAIVVSQKRQNQGIGTRLMNALMDAARGHDLTVMEGTVMAENKGMLILMDELGFARERSREDASLVVVERQL